MRHAIALLLAVGLVVSGDARADSNPTPTVPPSLVRTGISLTNTCTDVQTQTLTRRLALEIASARTRKPGSSTEVVVSCDDLQLLMVLLRPVPAPRITRAFSWEQSARKEPERWLALAIHQSLLDAGVVEPLHGPPAPTSIAKSKLEHTQVPLYPTFALYAEAGWRAMGIGSGWSRPGVGLVALVGRQSFAGFLRLGVAQAYSPRRIGRVRVQESEALAAFVLRKAMSQRTQARAWLGGGLLHVTMEGTSSIPSAILDAASGLGAIFGAGVGCDWIAWKRLRLGLGVEGGYVVGGVTGQVRGEKSVTTVGPWVGLTVHAGVAL